MSPKWAWKNYKIADEPQDYCRKEFDEMDLHHQVYLLCLLTTLRYVSTFPLLSRSSLLNLSNLPLTPDGGSDLVPHSDFTTRHPLLKRDWNDLTHLTNFFANVQHLGEGWQLHWSELDICRTNIDVVAGQLLHFYSQVLDAAGPVWSTQPPAPTHGAFLGDVSLHFYSEAPIAWEWIQSFLLNVILQTQHTPGDTIVTSYRIAFVSAVRTAPIWVQLILPWREPASGA
ncbi:MAG: hypothetical protein Q9219_007306 [cf. Caloplaca sp. 3 TL-2023]